MNHAYARWAMGSLVVVSACANVVGEPSTDTEDSALSFANGNDDGYCASSPSGSCRHGTPLAAKRVALTFDDGPGTQTGALSTWLKGQGIRATFFIRGKSLGSSATTLLAQLEHDGHLVANHTQNHVDLRSLGDTQIVAELSVLDAKIAPYVDRGRFVFRAPMGNWSAHVFSVLHASPMDKYVGPVKWDVGGRMTSSYAADWDCWQNTNGYGVLTTRQCGERYLREITDRGRGIVLMHDQDYGDSANHELDRGKGNTVDMAKYVVPRLVAQGYSFVRIDEVPEIAAALHDDAGAPVDAGTCVARTWKQTTYANEWWVEYAIGGDVASASLEIVGGPTVALARSEGKWVGSTPVRIAAGTSVVVHARDAAGAESRTQPFAYLQTTSPTSACDPPAPNDAGTPADAGAPADAGDDGGHATCAPSPTWTQTSYANEWWIEYEIAASTKIASVSLAVVGGRTVPLAASYGKWTGSTGAKIPAGTSVVIHATDANGDQAETVPFPYLRTTKPATEDCE